jgi:hypothetical protein
VKKRFIPHTCMYTVWWIGWGTVYWRGPMQTLTLRCKYKYILMYLTTIVIKMKNQSYQILRSSCVTDSWNIQRSKRIELTYEWSEWTNGNFFGRDLIFGNCLGLDLVYEWSLWIDFILLIFLKIISTILCEAERR